MITFFLLFIVCCSGLPGQETGVFQEVSFHEIGEIQLEPGALRAQARAVLTYLQEHKKDDPRTLRTGLFSRLNVSMGDVEATLRFIGKIIDEDITSKRPSRLTDPEFLGKHFRVFRWWPSPPRRDGKIRITKYAVFTIPGSSQKTSVFDCALYGLPEDEQGMSMAEAEKNKHKLTRFKYTKQQVLAGAVKNAPPLVWVTRDGLEEALMEGSVCVKMENGTKRFFNVDRGNEIPYNRFIKNRRDQERYWYFGEVKQPRGYGLDVRSQVRLFENAAVAGDVDNVGFGKFLGIRYLSREDGKKKMRLVLLADTGGAFTPNLRQLDYYVGICRDTTHFKQKTRYLPGYGAVLVFIKKSG